MSALSLDNLVQSVTKLTEDKVNLQTKLGTLSTKIEQMTNQSHALSGEEGALQKKHGELLGSSRNLQQECNAAKHQLESEKCSHLTLSSTVDALNTKKKTLDIDVAQRKAAYAADVENTSTSLQAIPDTLDNPGEWVKGFICSMFRYT
jgi:hypothetical protein